MTYRLAIDVGSGQTTWATTSRDDTEDTSIDGAVVESVVALSGAKLLAGDEVANADPAEVQHITHDFVQKLGDSTPLMIGGTPYGVESLIGHLLSSIVGTVRERRGAEPVAVLLVHNDGLDAYQTGLLTEAARLAGVPMADLVLVSRSDARAAPPVPGLNIPLGLEIVAGASLLGWALRPDLAAIVPVAAAGAASSALGVVGVAGGVAATATGGAVLGATVIGHGTAAATAAGAGASGAAGGAAVVAGAGPAGSALTAMPTAGPAGSPLTTPPTAGPAGTPMSTPPTAGPTGTPINTPPTTGPAGTPLSTPPTAGPAGTPIPTSPIVGPVGAKIVTKIPRRIPVVVASVVAVVAVVAVVVVATNNDDTATLSPSSISVDSSNPGASSGGSAVPGAIETGRVCVHGTWAMSNENFKNLIGSLGGLGDLGTFEVSGSTQIDIAPDGVWTMTYNDWALTAALNDVSAQISVTINGVDTTQGEFLDDGTYSFTDMSIGSEMTTSAVVNGAEVPIPADVRNRSAVSGSGTYTCEGDVLTMTAPESPSAFIMDRIG